MIYFLVTRQHAYTIHLHLDTWGRRLRSAIRPVYYDQLAYYRRLAVGTYFFTDLERLSEPEMELARLAWGALAESGQPVRLLNDPAKLLRRQALLERLHGGGINPFAVYRGDRAQGVRFPAFIRRPDEHDGSLTPLLHNPTELAAALAQLQRDRGFSADRLLVVEHCDTIAADGLYRKYGAFVVGGRIIARHLLMSRSWVVKGPEIVTAEQQAEELAYLEGNPHEAPLREVFGLANIDFGRVDYSLLDGKLVVWEINTNPMLGLDPAKISPPRLGGQAMFCRQLNEALLGLNLDSPPIMVPLNISASLKRQLGVRYHKRAMRGLGRALQRVLRCAS